MGSLIFVLITIALLAAFLALTQWEQARGRRLLSSTREQLDLEVERAVFVARHVDWGAYASEQMRAFSLWLGHEVAHLSLRFVRFIERILAKTVRQLRHQAASSESAAAEPTRPFIEALSDFKEELKDSRPDNIDAPPE